MRTGRFFGATIFWVMFCSVSFGYSGWIAGKVGNALTFDGINDYVEVPGYQGIAGSASRTCSAWIKTTKVSGEIITWGPDTTGKKWIVRVNDTGELRVEISSGYIYGTTVLTDGAWHHIAVTLYDDSSPDVSEIKLYVDGQLDTVKAYSVRAVNTSNTVNVRIGSHYSLQRYFQGLIDEVCIYNRALGGSEINPNGPISTVGLVAYWAMDETEGKIAHDSVSSYNGILRYMIEGYSGGDGSTVNPYQIASKADLLALGATTFDYNQSFILIDDIDLTGETFTQAVIAPNIEQGDLNFHGTPFTGIFNGNGHTIHNLTITGGENSYIGLFGYIGTGGQVKNLGVVYANIQGKFSVGGLAGWNNSGTISTCYTTGSVSGSEDVGGLVGLNIGTINTCYAMGLMSGDFSVGGLVGDNFSGTINSCYATGSVNGTGTYVGGLVGKDYSGTISTCYATGSVNGSGEVGGLVGLNESGAITICYATGSVSGGVGNYGNVGGLVGWNNSGTITICYATGSVVSGNSDVGGLVGWNLSGTITACYATGSVSGIIPVGGLVGESSSGTISTCYATGLITSEESGSGIGGLLGWNYGAVLNCFWDVQTSGCSNSTNSFGMGMTTAAMKTLSTFTSAGWDFTNETANGTNNYWRMCADGVDYPRLNWESIDGDFACPAGVSTEDLDYFVGRWLLNNCTSSNNFCGGVDMNSTGKVDLADFSIFAQYWLEGI